MGIGVDADQFFLGPHLLTSALKRVDVAVYADHPAAKENPSGFRGGFDTMFGIKNSGVGYGWVSPRLKNRAAIIRQTEAIKKLIPTGKIVPPVKSTAARRPGSASAASGAFVRRPPPGLGSDRMADESPCSSCAESQAVPGDRRQRSREPRPPARRGTRAPRRERRRQVDAHERRLRPLPAGRG